MEWVDSVRGRVPDGRRAVDTGGKDSPRGGGWDLKLWHAVIWFDEIWVPGKAGTHLVSFGSRGGEEGLDGELIGTSRVAASFVMVIRVF